jgi:hypothetical protein
MTNVLKIFLLINLIAATSFTSTPKEVANDLFSLMEKDKIDFKALLKSFEKVENFSEIKDLRGKDNETILNKAFLLALLNSEYLAGQSNQNRAAIIEIGSVMLKIIRIILDRNGYLSSPSKISGFYPIHFAVVLAQYNSQEEDMLRKIIELDPESVHQRTDIKLGIHTPPDEQMYKHFELTPLYIAYKNLY